MEVLIYFLFSVIIGFILYAFWCYFYTRSGKASSFHNYMHRNEAYDWIFFGSLLWPFSLLGLIIISICLLICTITRLIRHMFKINE